VAMASGDTATILHLKMTEGHPTGKERRSIKGHPAEKIRMLPYPKLHLAYISRVHTLLKKERKRKPGFCQTTY